LKKDRLLDLIESSYKHAGPGVFKDAKEALQVVGSALRYLTNQCDDMETREVPEATDEPKAEDAN
jgi:hypothetical protein